MKNSKMKNSNDLSRRDFLRAGAISAAAFSAIPAIADTADADTPAVLGGPAARTIGAPGWPQWSSDFNEEMANVMSRCVWSRSERVSEFERQWAEMNGAKHCLAVVNGTNALSASFMELDINPGDEVICSPYTFSASVFGILYKGAMPVWADIDPETSQVDVEKLRAKITPRTKAIMVVHICGNPADMTAIMEIAREHNLFVVEDACQAHLATINGKKVGTFGNAGCFSFQTSKCIPVGEGGGILTDDPDFYDRLFSYHNYGYATTISPGTWGSIHAFRLANKIRMAEYQAMIGLCQLRSAEENHIKRNENGNYLRELLADLQGVHAARYCPGVDSVSHYLFPMIYEAGNDVLKGMTRDQFINALVAEGVPASVGYPNDPLYGQKLIETTFESPIYKKFYGDIDFEAYKEENNCPALAKTCDTSIWISGNGFFLADKRVMDQVYLAFKKVLTHAEEIAKA